MEQLLSAEPWVSAKAGITLPGGASHSNSRVRRCSRKQAETEVQVEEGHEGRACSSERVVGMAGTACGSGSVVGVAGTARLRAWSLC